MNRLFTVIFLLLLAGTIAAQDEDDYPPEASAITLDSIITGHYKNMYRADSVLAKNPVSDNEVYPKTFKENLPSRYKGPEFDYMTVQPRESFWDRLMRKIDRLIQSIFGETDFGSSTQTTWLIVRLFAILIIGFLLYFIVKYFLAKEGSWFFGKKNNKTNIGEEELHENIHEINFSESIAGFEASGDYRSAVRYQFLMVLKKLSDKKLISWNPEKTNKDYIAELKVPQLKQQLSHLAYIFEYVWYGEFEVNEQSYLNFKKEFQSFNP